MKLKLDDAVETCRTQLEHIFTTSRWYLRVSLAINWQQLKGVFKLTRKSLDRCASHTCISLTTFIAVLLVRLAQHLLAYHHLHLCTCITCVTYKACSERTFDIDYFVCVLTILSLNPWVSCAFDNVFLRDGWFGSWCVMPEQWPGLGPWRWRWR